MPIAAYRLRHLTDEQTREISSKLAGEQGGAFRPAGANDSHIVVGALVPADVALSGLSPVPEALAGKFPRAARCRIHEVGREIADR